MIPARHAISGFASALMFACVPAGHSLAQEAGADFPQVVTIQDVLNMATDDVPAILGSKANLAAREAQLLALDADFGTSVVFDLDLRSADKVVPSRTDFEGDSRASILVSKPLTDFGVRELLSRSLQTGLDSAQLELRYSKSLQRIEIMEAYFNVIVADYAYGALDEQMTVNFLEFDDAREDMERFGEVSEIEVTRLEAAYRSAFAQRARGAQKQRATRLKLALAVNRPGHWPDQLIEPDLSAYDRPLPQYQELLGQILERSPLIQAARLAADSQQVRLDATSRSTRPTLNASLLANDYEQEISRVRDRYRASLNLRFPIYARLSRQSQIATESAELLRRESELRELEFDLREKVLELVNRLEVLETEIAAAETELLYRELDLDKTRLLYEMEVRARLGNANAKVAESIYELARLRYEKALIWEHIDALAAHQPVIFKQ